MWDLAQPFFVSLITFGVLVGRQENQTLLTNLLLGFETGFFWQTILASRSPAAVAVR